MAQKYVSDTSAGKAISALAIFNKKGELVGKILAHHGSSCMVNVWDWGKSSESTGIFQRATVGGYGYDKFTAALDGLVIDGVRMYDHCGKSPLCDKAMRQMAKVSGIDACREIEAKWKKKGVTFANWDREEHRYTSAYMQPGYKIFQDLGYRVVGLI